MTRERPPTAQPRPTGPAGRAVVGAALLAGGALIIGLWWQLSPPTAVANLAGRVTTAGRLCGLLGSYLVLAQIMLMARLPWLERAIGFDRLAGWHRALGTNTVLLLGAHVVLVVEGYALTSHRAAPAEGWTILRGYPHMLSATAGLLLFGALAVTAVRAVRQRLSYEAWYLVHLGAYVAVALSVLHQLDAGADFASRPAARVLWAGMYAGVAGCVLWWRVVLPVRAWLRHAMTVERVVPESPGVVSVWIRGRHLDRLGARPGQFLLWRFVAAGHLGTAHPYSLSAVPTPNRLRITVKAAGDHSAALRRIRPGVAVLAEGPFGHFTAVPTGRRVLLIAAGAGIAPIRALASGFGWTGRPEDVVVVYRVRRHRDLALGAELADLAQRGLLVLHVLAGRRRELGYDPLAPGHLLRLVPDLAYREVYACGPPELTAALRAGLPATGLPDRQLHTEEFGW